MHKVPNTSFPHMNRKVSVWGRLTEDALQIYHKEKRPRLLAFFFPICTQISYAALLEISRKIPTGNNMPIGICLLSAIDENPTLQYISCHPGYRYHHVSPGVIPFGH